MGTIPVVPEQLEEGHLMDVRQEDLALDLDDLACDDGLPDDLGANADGSIGRPIQVRQSAQEELGVPGVVVVMYGDVRRRAGVNGLVRRRLHTSRRRVMNDGHAASERFCVLLEKVVHRFRVPSVVDDVQVPVLEDLVGDVAQRPRQQQRSVLGAHHDGDRRLLNTAVRRCHEWSMGPVVDPVMPSAGIKPQVCPTDLLTYSSPALNSWLRHPVKLKYSSNWMMLPTCSRGPTRSSTRTAEL